TDVGHYHSCWLDAHKSLLTFSSSHPSTPDIYTLSLHDALPILLIVTGKITSRITTVTFDQMPIPIHRMNSGPSAIVGVAYSPETDRKSTRLNSSHRTISYAVFCLKKKNHKQRH